MLNNSSYAGPEEYEKISPGRNLKKIKGDYIKMNKVNAEKLMLIFNVVCTLIF